LQFVVEGSVFDAVLCVDHHGGSPGGIMVWPVKVGAGWLATARERQPPLLDPGRKVLDLWSGPGPGCDARYTLGAENEWQPTRLTGRRALCSLGPAEGGGVVVHPPQGFEQVQQRPVARRAIFIRKIRVGKKTQSAQAEVDGDYDHVACTGQP